MEKVHAIIITSKHAIKLAIFGVFKKIHLAYPFLEYYDVYPLKIIDNFPFWFYG